jgi:hypothetical protein
MRLNQANYFCLLRNEQIMLGPTIAFHPITQRPRAGASAITQRRP